MNEVTKIHLGRQAFTIAVDAHRELRAYLDAIKKQVEDKDVIDEVELRMAELLDEHGVKANKVILAKDVDFLKKQLGNPKDFKEDAEAETPAAVSTENKRLFRDTDNAMLAGVAAGLSAYFGIDVLLVRILFAVGILAWGGGILLYILLWLLVPEAKTTSERLQMAGKPVTLESLKEVVERADVKGAARRANKTIEGPASRIRDVINTLFRLCVKIVGVSLTIIGLGLLISLLVGSIYLIVHGNVIQDHLFPVGFKEHLLVYIAAFVAALLSLFIILFGMSVFARKWPIRAWLSGVLVGLTAIGLISGAALAADIAPRVRDRYNANLHSVTRSVQPFSTVNALGEGVELNIESSSTYYVTFKYFDSPDISKIKTTVSNGILLIDSSNFNWHPNCSTLCIPNTYNVVATVHSPNMPSVDFPYGPGKAVFPGDQKFYYQ